MCASDVARESVDMPFEAPMIRMNGMAVPTAEISGSCARPTAWPKKTEATIQRPPPPRWAKKARGAHPARAEPHRDRHEQEPPRHLHGAHPADDPRRHRSR